MKLASEQRKGQREYYRHRVAQTAHDRVPNLDTDGSLVHRHDPLFKLFRPSTQHQIRRVEIFFLVGVPYHYVRIILHTCVCVYTCVLFGLFGGNVRAFD